MDITNQNCNQNNLPTRPKIILGIAGVLIAFSAPVVQAWLYPWFLKNFTFPMDRFVSLWVFWIALVIALGIAVLGEGYSLAAFGFQRSTKTLRKRLIEWILTALATLVIGGVMVFFSTYIRGLLTDEPAPALSIVQTFPVWVLIPAWITGSFTEEVLFRSYPIERLTHMFKRPWLAGLITLLAFSLLHLLTWDWIHVLTLVFPGSLMLTLFYLWRRNLALNVIIHAIMNAPLLLLPLLQPFL